MESLGIAVAPEVSDALARGAAVVALESTIICHGMPYPQSLQTAIEVETIVRENGAIPATIAILDGIPHIGLNNEQLKRLAMLGRKVQKTARRDIAHILIVKINGQIDIQGSPNVQGRGRVASPSKNVLAEHNELAKEEYFKDVLSQKVASNGNGATTVSATMFFAYKVGIPIFVSGGIGGVHRHGEQTMDVSSDLTELGKTPVTVVAAGAKSILDIPRTLEYLETQGVTVAAYRTNEFPAFFTEVSGCKVPCRLDSPEECAKLIYANMNLGLGSGILIAVPIPKEHVASGNVIESAIQNALKEAEDKNIKGNASTPFLLDRVKELTGGASLEANIALVKNNVLVGAKIAVALSDLRRRVTNSKLLPTHSIYCWLYALPPEKMLMLHE